MRPHEGSRHAISVLLQLCIPAAVALSGCSDPTAASGDRQRSGRWRADASASSVAVLTAGEQCLEVPDCGMESGNCVCHLDGIDVNVPGGSGFPGSWPSWPAAPGFPDPDFGSWPEPPGGGSWPNLPPAGPGECDPYAIYGGCFWTATLVCPSGVTRGSTGSCTFSIDPADKLDYISGWTFSGENITKSVSSTSPAWGGVLIESGEVRVDFVAGGRESAVVSQIGVVPRTGWNWDTSKRSFATGAPGDLDNCITTQAGLTADKDGCTSSNPGVLINPGANQGFTITPVNSGPNAGGWYVTNPTTRMDLRTQVAKKYRTDEVKVPVNGVSEVVQACTATYGTPIPPQNNHGINTGCTQVAEFTSLVSFAWSHEGQHLAAAQPEAEKPENNIYAQWEPIVQTQESAAFNQANQIQNMMHDNVATAANSTHTGASTDFHFWYNTGSGIWQWSTVTVQH